MAFQGLKVSGDADNNLGIKTDTEIRAIVKDAFTSGQTVTIPAGRELVLLYDDSIETSNILACLEKLKIAFLNLDG